MNAETALTSAHVTIDSAVTEWLAQKETIGSKRTRAEYQETMRRFRALLAQGGLDLLSNPIDIARIAALWANMREVNSRRPGQDVSPAMYNQRLAILSSFYTFLQDTYKLEIPNPIKDVKKRKVQAYAAALSIAPETVEEGLDRIDRNSLAGQRGSDVKLQGRTQVRIQLTFHCKGNKVMRDLLDADTSAVLLDYLHAHYGKQLLTLPDDAPIWVSYSRQNKGQAISTKTLSNICAAHLDTSKVHALRHTFAVGMVRSGAPITDLAGRLGHTDIKITQLYTKELLGDENPYGEKLSARFGIKRKTTR